ncbi:GGDEF domain-containing protein [uncultured Ferrimonas sp.]|uniref:GGDEF domain-containing protein n=1 Tax=uncultured Ferrimonas sp. TaxID=432640 RepID=UPI00263795FF|nr:GGDEF domain-containing protein [uncultured Ferrimonas sp.]
MALSQQSLQHKVQSALLLAVAAVQGLQWLAAFASNSQTPWLFAAVMAPLLAQFCLGKASVLQHPQLCVAMVSGTIALSLPHQPHPNLTLLLLLPVVAAFASNRLMLALTVLPSLLSWLWFYPQPLWAAAWLLVATLIGYQSGLLHRLNTLQRRQNQRLQWQKQRNGNRDRLTQLRNKRYFEQRLQQSVSEAKRSKNPLSLIILDIDYFRAYNDHYGHAEGDLCLRAVASQIKAASQRQSDVIARLQGGTFALLLPTTDRKGAERLAQQISTQVQQANIGHHCSPISRKITLTQGLSQWQPGLEAEHLLERAKRTLAQAKVEGRDQIKVA